MFAQQFRKYVMERRETKVTLTWNALWQGSSNLALSI